MAKKKKGSPKKAAKVKQKSEDYPWWNPTGKKIEKRTEKLNFNEASAELIGEVTSFSETLCKFLAKAIQEGAITEWDDLLKGKPRSVWSFGPKKLVILRELFFLGPGAPETDEVKAKLAVYRAKVVAHLAKVAANKASRVNISKSKKSKNISPKRRKISPNGSEAEKVKNYKVGKRGWPDFFFLENLLSECINEEQAISKSIDNSMWKIPVKDINALTSSEASQYFYGENVVGIPEAVLSDVGNFRTKPDSSIQKNVDIEIQAGGTVTALDWYHGSTQSQSYLAVGCHTTSTANNRYPLGKLVKGKCAIQIWRIHQTKTKLMFAIAVDSAFVSDIKWKPGQVIGGSGNRKSSTEIPSLGLLAAVLSTGNIIVWDVPNPETQVTEISHKGKEILLSSSSNSPPCRIVKLQPVLVASIPSTMMYRITWAPWNFGSSTSGEEIQQSHYRYGFLLGGSCDGRIGLWNVTSSSTSHDRDDAKQPLRVIAPFKATHLPPAVNAITSIAFCPHNSYIFSSSSYDNCVRVWDIRSPGLPIASHGFDVPVVGVVWPEGHSIIATTTSGDILYLPLESFSREDIKINRMESGLYSRNLLQKKRCAKLVKHQNRYDRCVNCSTRAYLFNNPKYVSILAVTDIGEANVYSTTLASYHSGLDYSKGDLSKLLMLAKDEGLSVTIMRPAESNGIREKLENFDNEYRMTDSLLATAASKPVKVTQKNNEPNSESNITTVSWVAMGGRWGKVHLIRNELYDICN